MRRSLLLLIALFGIAFAEDGCVCEINAAHRSKRAAAWGTNFVGARIDAQEMRIAQLSKSIAHLADKVDHDDDHDYNRVVGELTRRIESIEGTDCHDHQFSCGRTSGHCISDLLVCDHKNDCDNGHDEDHHVCENQVPAGRSWSGDVNWNSCRNRRHTHINVLITGNRRMNHFPTRLWVDAVIIEKWHEDHHEVTKTWNSHGFWNFANHHLVLDPPEGSSKRIGMICEDAGEGIADCKMVRESDLHQCGHAILTRAV